MRGDSLADFIIKGIQSTSVEGYRRIFLRQS